MASSLDNFNDLEELGIDCDDEDNDSLTSIFNRATNHLQTLLPNVDNQTLIELYGYYKQATQGPCNTSKPSWYDIKAKSKWESWKKLENMSKDQAKTEYIKIIKNLDRNFNDDLLNQPSKKEQWISVSIPVQETFETIDKNLIDHIQENNHVEFEELLIVEHIDNLDESGLALIHWAADRGSKEILEILIKRGADVNLKDTDGQTALHYASSCGHIECVKFLLICGAEKNIFDNEQQTPLDVANDNTVKELFD